MVFISSWLPKACAQRSGANRTKAPPAEHRTTPQPGQKKTSRALPPGRLEVGLIPR